MNVIEKLKTLGVEITPEMEKALAGEWTSELELQRKADKIKILEGEIATLTKSHEDLQKELSAAQDGSKDAQEWKNKLEEVTKTLETERNARKEKEFEDKLSEQIGTFFKDKHFVNDITSDAVRTQLIASLKSDDARGKSISDLFDGIVKDEKGVLKPNILIDDKNFNAGQNRSSFSAPNTGTGAGNVTREQFLKMGMTERSKLKEISPELYEQLKKG